MPTTKKSTNYQINECVQPDPFSIALTAESKTALKAKGPSDKRLKEILITNCQSKSATDREQRWMAGQILRSSGYKFVGG